MRAAEPFRIEAVIAAPPEAVWSALVDRAALRRWMNRAEISSTWEPGAPIVFDVVLEGVVRHDRGTVLDVEQYRLLRYSHWSEISRLPDTPETRSIAAFELEPESGRRTRLTVTVEGYRAGAAARHASFFWPVAVAALQAVAEGRAVSGLALMDANGPISRGPDPA